MRGAATRWPGRLGLLGLLACLGCPGGGGGRGGALVCATEAPEADAVAFALAFGGERFEQPVALLQHPGDPDRFYVLELGGRIFTLLASDPAGSRAEALDVTDFVTLFTGGEGGLLGMAFDPDFAGNGDVYLSYTEGVAGNFDSVLARFHSDDAGLSFAPAAADPGLLAVSQPAGNHNGGDLDFGPDDFLYWALGDGGGAGDPFENGQDTSTLLGAILRLDVGGAALAIPPDNPFVGSAGADEIFAFGLRNPWRMSFDRDTGELWAGDVGQDTQEEVDKIVAGGNYGWDCREGLREFELDASCQPAPIAPELVHAQPEFRSITGGHVYRGSAITELDGAYVYGDFASGRVCAYFDSGPRRSVSLDPPGGLSVVAFGEDGDGELYLVDFGTPGLANGEVYAIEPAP